MGSFRDKLGKLIAKITGKPLQKDVKRTSVEDLCNKHTTGWQSAEPLPPKISVQPPQLRPVEQNVSRDSASLTNKAALPKRSAYFFQIGFDFGTSSSKAVIRDININRAWAYTVLSAADHFDFLIPSVVIYRDGKFERHLNSDMLYPKGGLYHLKMAVEKVALDKLDDELLLEYRRILGQSTPYSSSQIAKFASIYFLASAFSSIINSIIQRFPDYGKDEGDQIAINMAIPVANISDSRVRTLFEKILNISWMIAWDFDSRQHQLSINDLRQKIKNCEAVLSEHGENELCQVYPEVSANVQAFVRSPASSPDDTTIYFFSDIGAGTVDQSVFTYARKADRRLLNYFSAGVFPLGSGQIEIAAYSETRDESLEHWRKEKELGKESPPLRRAKIKVDEALTSDTGKVLRDTQPCLASWGGDQIGRVSIDPISTLKDKVKFIFSGGGYTEFPYKHAIVYAFKNLLRTIQEPIVTSMAYPTDLDIPKNYEHWVKRLYVAYGLSFLYHELAENTYPSDNILNRTEHEEIKIIASQYCSCRGINKNCSKCYGTGTVQ